MKLLRSIPMRVWALVVLVALAAWLVVSKMARRAALARVDADIDRARVRSERELEVVDRAEEELVDAVLERELETIEALEAERVEIKRAEAAGSAAFAKRWAQAFGRSGEGGS